MERDWSGITSLAHLIAEDLYNMVAVASYDALAEGWVFYYANRAFSSVYGSAAEGVMGASVSSLGTLIAGDSASWDNVVDSLRRREPLHVVVAPPSDTPRAVDLALSPIETPVGPRLVAVGCPRDMFPQLPTEVVIPESKAWNAGGAITRNDLVRPDDGSQMAVICSGCERLRTSSGEFVPVEQFLVEKLAVRISDGLCEACYQEALRSNGLIEAD